MTKHWKMVEREIGGWLRQNDRYKYKRYCIDTWSDKMDNNACVRNTGQGVSKLRCTDPHTLGSKVQHTDLWLRCWSISLSVPVAVNWYFRISVLDSAFHRKFSSFLSYHIFCCQFKSLRHFRSGIFVWLVLHQCALKYIRRILATIASAYADFVVRDANL